MPAMSQKAWSSPSRRKKKAEREEVEPLCPQPFRAVQRPGSPGEHLGLPGSPDRQSVHDEADKELRELMGLGDKESFSSLGGRPLSSQSTCAGPTPGLESRPISSADTLPQTPQWPRINEHSAEHDREALTSCSTPAPGVNGPTPQSSSKGPRNSNKPPKAHKVFIGGVPQDVEEDEVHQVLSEHSPGVKKCWLQKHKEVNVQKHRGFGFALFSDGGAVDRLLGGDESRFLQLRGGRRVEVKRAVPSMELQRADTPTDLAIGPRSSPGPGMKQQLALRNGTGTPQAPHAPPGNWPVDPRQQLHGGYTTPEQHVTSLMSSPNRMSPLPPGMLTPDATRCSTPMVPPPSPNCMITTLPDGRCMVSAIVPQSQAVISGCGGMPPRPSDGLAGYPSRPCSQNGQQAPAASSGPPQAMALSAPGGASVPPHLPGWQVASPQQWQAAGMPWQCMAMPGGMSGGNYTGMPMQAVPVQQQLQQPMLQTVPSPQQQQQQLHQQLQLLQQQQQQPQQSQQQQQQQQQLPQIPPTPPPPQQQEVKAANQRSTTGQDLLALAQDPQTSGQRRQSPEYWRDLEERLQQAMPTCYED